MLKYLLGYGDVKNYDGSWTEWGNLVGAPVERAAGTSAGATTTATAAQVTLKPEDYQRREDEYEGWPIRCVIQVGTSTCEVDNVSPGARLAACKPRLGMKPSAGRLRRRTRCCWIREHSARTDAEW